MQPVYSRTSESTFCARRGSLCVHSTLNSNQGDRAHGRRAHLRHVVRRNRSGRSAWSIARQGERFSPAASRSYDLIFDIVGATTFDRCQHALKPQGTFLQNIMGVTDMVYTDTCVGFAAARAATERAATRYHANRTTITESIATATPAWWFKYRAPRKAPAQ